MEVATQVVLAVISFVYCIKKMFAERIEKFFAEEIERSKAMCECHANEFDAAAFWREFAARAAFRRRVRSGQNAPELDRRATCSLMRSRRSRAALSHFGAISICISNETHSAARDRNRG